MAAPIISSVTWYSKAKQVVVSGTGFGSHAPYAGNSDFIALQDNNFSVDEGHTGDGRGLNVTRWTDTQIVFSWTPFSFGVDPFVGPGHSVKITVWNPALEATFAPLIVPIDEPIGLTLSPGSDSGSKGDNITNVVAPVISGSGDP